MPDAEKWPLVIEHDDAPSGEVTFLFTDLEGSTQLWERVPEAMDGALAEHDRRLRMVFAQRSGGVFTTAGDSFAVAFRSATDAVHAAVEVQQQLLDPCVGIDLRVRIGLHTGTATARDGDYFGAVVNRAARLMSSAHGRQIIVSGATATQLTDHLDNGITLIDFGEHRLKDLLRPERIFEVRHPDLDDGFPPLRTLEGPWSNLPVQLTSFVGRKRELAEVAGLLRDHRLVTITGSGGAGKTRLALQVAADLLEDFPDGIRFVELAAVVDPQYIADEIAAAVDAQASPNTPLVETIGQKIGDQRMLLVLDNNEHLVDDVARLIDRLLNTSSGVKILATSRERLNLSMEVAYRLPSLAMPDLTPAQAGERDLDLDQIRKYDAVRLFTDRAMLAKADFDLTAGNADAVVSICQRLDGIPLALELAAARLRALSPEQVASRLDERFRLLGSTSRGTLERHRTLAAAIDWSYEHLSEDERAVFRRASVFAGSFDIEAAEYVCVGDDIDPFDVLDHITALIDKSMLVPEDNSYGQISYRLLESMRQYGATMVTANDESLRFSIAHLEYYVGLAERLRARERGGDISGALVALGRDDGNIRAALRFSLDCGQHVDAARIIGAIGYLWYVSGSFREGIEWCRGLFDTDPKLPDQILAGALHSYALMFGSWSNPESGVEILTREVEIRRRIADPGRLAAALNNLGCTYYDLGRTAEGELALREAIKQFRLANEPATISIDSIAYSYMAQGRYDEAGTLLREAFDEAVASRNDYGLALTRSHLGEVAVHQGKSDLARALLSEARSDFEAIGVRPGVNGIDMHLAIVDIAEGSVHDAAGRLRAALSEPDTHWYNSSKFWILQLVAAIVDDPATARQLLAISTLHYDGSPMAQPVWVQEHLTATTHILQEVDDQSDGPDIIRQLDLAEAIVAANNALERLIAREADR